VNALFTYSLYRRSHEQNVIRFLLLGDVYTAVNKCHFSHVSLESSANVTMLLCFNRVTRNAGDIGLRTITHEIFSP